MAERTKATVLKTVSLRADAPYAPLRVAGGRTAHLAARELSEG
jgi:hypothetical protein